MKQPTDDRGPSRRRFLRWQLAAAAAASLAGCNDFPPGPEPSPSPDETGAVSGRVLNLEDDGVPDIPVGVVATVETGNGYETRVIASGRTETDGFFELPLANIDTGSESVVSHSSGPDVIVFAQTRPESATSDSSVDDLWFGTAGANLPRATSTTQFRLRLNNQVILSDWGSSLAMTDVSVWRTIDRTNPANQSLTIEARGKPQLGGDGAGEYHPLEHGQLLFGIPDDRPEQVTVDYPDQNFHRPLWASGEETSYSDPSLWRLGGASWNRFSLAEAVADAFDEEFQLPLYALFSGDGFSPLTEAERQEVTETPEWLELTDEAYSLFIEVLGIRLEDVATALSALDWAKAASEYAYDTLDLPDDIVSPQYLGNGTRPSNFGPNDYDAVFTSWPKVAVGVGPSAVVHQIDLTVETAAGTNRQEIVAEGGWKPVGVKAARLTQGFTVDFARITPGVARAESQPTQTATPTPTSTPSAETIPGEWSQRLTDPQNTGHSQTSTPSGTLTEAWSFDAGSYYDPLFGSHYSAVTDGDLLYVCTGYGPLIALRPDGTPEWRFSEPRAPNGVAPTGLAVGDERVYMTMAETTTPAVDEQPAIYAVSKDDGSPKWRYRFPELEFGGRFGAVGQPTLVDETLFAFAPSEYTAGDRSPGESPLIALDAKTGDFQWRVQVTGVRGNNGFAPAVTDTTIVLNTGDALHAYDRRSRDIEWTIDVDVPSRVAIAEETALVLGSPPESEGRGLLAYDLSAGGQTEPSERLQWETFTDDPAAELDQFTVDPEAGVAYLTETDSLEPDRLHEIDITDDGAVVTSYTHDSVGAGGDPIVCPVCTDDVVYFGDPYGTLTGIDRETGETRFAVEHDGISNYPLAIGDKLYTTGETLRAWDVG